jgi:hypothetical protein
MEGEGGVEGKLVFGLTFTRLWARQAGRLASVGVSLCSLIRTVIMKVFGEE